MPSHPKEKLLVEGVFEFAVGVANRQDWAGCFLDYAFGYAAHQDVGQAGPSVGAEHDQIGGLALRGVEDFQEWRADLEQSLHFESGGAQISAYLVEFLLREPARLFGDSPPRADCHIPSELRR